MRPRRIGTSGVTLMALAMLLALTAAAPNGARAQLPLDKPSTSESTSESSAELIPVDPEGGPGDSAISARILSLFDRNPGLSGVKVVVQDGIVTLSGTVSSQEDHDLAVALAGRVQGVVMVSDQLQSDVTVRTRFGAAMEGIERKTRAFISLTPVLLVAVLIVAAGGLAARLVGRWEALFSRVSRNVFLRDLLRQVVQVAIFLAGIVIALMVLDATALIGSIAGALGILGLAIGFATRDTVENYIASILLSLRQPFRSEDFVRIDDTEGKVLRLTSRATVLMSLDGNHVRIPNARVFKATIVNYTRNPFRRFEFTVGVDTELDLSRPRQLALDTLATLPAVLDDPEPVCLVDELGDSSVILVMRAWVDQREHDLPKTRSEAQRLIKEAFDDAGILMPEPIYNVNLRRAGAGQATTTSPDARATRDPDLGSDTRRDDTVESQMRADPAPAERDLLDPSAPVE